MQLFDTLLTKKYEKEIEFVDLQKISRLADQNLPDARESRRLLAQFLPHLV